MAKVDLERLNPDLRARVQALVAASGGRITITSGYRTPEYQASLVERIKKQRGADWRKWVAPPGKSNHNRGEAVDLGGDLELAKKLAPQFNLSFPMSWEPWHVQRAEFKSTKSSLTPPPAPGDVRLAQSQGESQGVTLPPPAVSLAPEADRGDIGVQLGTLMEILRNPVDFKEGVPF